MQVQGRVFLVTGGASGLGAATAEHLISAGAKVVIADMNSETGERLVSRLGDSCAFAKVNVTSADQVQDAIQLAVERFGGLHGAINCAGIGNPEKVLGRQGPHRLESFAKVIEVNLIGTFNVIRLAALQMSLNAGNEQGERGVLINTASIAAFDGQIGQAAYAASKGGVVGLTLPVARELASSGIRVCTIAPGLFATPILEMLPEEARKALGDQVPFPSRLGYPEEFAQLARHIIENPMLNGETIRLDGALRMPPR
ncbi:3-hydroxyacyl-CoA dehydrogenase [Pseudomonas sessilinigenes]|uniref:3-hydroxyacyl-CoA dehydrogenase n=1 Tax=Pseudomonas sessilinigenes TaxID=658629 RepID=A0ABX8MNX9_9PSED|nr:3-hydroxyacyl-CoA dehydrogenase [Pseudomonas sessilinigenes]AZC26639.1 3-hydroxyacyl-CoA dehydrogenase [Pseudomonas sessilinigenes]QXH39370.1 3-hydroxyacyl-CoA dehydrogenase [Pseudomonas sessilinigenes]